MKNFIGFVFLLGFVLLAFVADTLATDIKVGAKGKMSFQLNSIVGPSQLEFKSEAPMEDTEGKVDLETISSSISINPSKIESSTGKISFKVKGMRTGIKSRDKHLWSDVWLDADKFPDIYFDLKKIVEVKVSKPEDGKTIVKGMAIGNFSMHGNSKEVKANISITYLEESEATKRKAQGDLFFVEGDFEIALADYKVAGMKGIIGSKVGKSIKIKFKLFYSQVKK